ncbi:hypothetical protein [Micromonospora sp. PLK6-60]|uniref:hypothetical protein n=1 Tax=Micromonospora sp. PLK6-60 TaxID=2873383 RepID=UPI0021063C7D|nr:hypothetical protein [Micromonospora sp. PLK6-60]
MVALTSPVPPDQPAPDHETLFFIIVLGICWGLGTGHVVLLNRAVMSALSRASGAGQRGGAEERRARREQARHLLHHYPSARVELHIGRPDLPRTFDDGGLVDVNAVPDQVLAGLPGLTDDQRRLIITDRRRHGPYGSLEELGGRCPLPAATTALLRDVLIFVPPLPFTRS